jgi:hypothetical protein
MKPAKDELAFGRSDLEAAVAKGILEKPVADSLLDFLVQNRKEAAGDPDEERLRLITGFNDIFVTIGIALFLGALRYLLGDYGSIGVAVASWGLAEVFTKRKRMALPSIVLLIVFVMSCAGISNAIFNADSRVLSVFSYFDSFGYGDFPGLPYGFAAIAASVLHWLRFRVPITIAAFAAGLAMVAVAAIETFKNGFVLEHLSLVFIPIGLAIFAVAMKFDMSDRSRLTQRTDIAFWLHLLAAPLIVHSAVHPLLSESALSTGTAISIISLFAVLSFIALAVDRRALLVSSLLYLGYASAQILTWSGIATESVGLAVLIVGGTVLALSVAWQPMRRIVLHILPQNLRDLVPPATKPA